MLTPFPELLTYGFFAPTIIRVMVAFSFAGIAYAVYTRRDEIAHISFPIVGKAAWLAPVSALVHALIAAALFVGYYTQIAAILAILSALKQAYFAKQYPRAIPLCRAEYILLVAMCLSLLLSGAGAMALDLPL